MTATLNAHKVFKGSGNDPAYLQALDISEKAESRLRKARQQIRETLRKGMPAWSNLVLAHGLIESRFRSQIREAPSLRPRFRRQGSEVYGTLNAPAHMPPQEIDFDDGLYLPVSFISANGSNEPVLAARGYFKIVEETLRPLCEKNGWELIEKENCVRVKLDEEAHIDIPLYAIPDEQFVELTEAARALASVQSPADQGSDLRLNEHVYKNLREDQIMLARREEGWQESDPRKLEDWFNGAIAVHGSVLRRVCRYLKGWRDFQWKKGGPSSIAIMACAVEAFDRLEGVLPENRDDTAILLIAHELPSLFGGVVPNPVLPDQDLTDGWDPEKRQEYISRAADFGDRMSSALNGNFNRQIAYDHFARLFGDRIPDDWEFMILDTAEQEVQAYEPAAVQAPYVPRTISG